MCACVGGCCCLPLSTSYGMSLAIGECVYCVLILPMTQNDITAEHDALTHSRAARKSSTAKQASPPFQCILGQFEHLQYIRTITYQLPLNCLLERQSGLTQNEETEAFHQRPENETQNPNKNLDAIEVMCICNLVRDQQRVAVHSIEILTTGNRCDKRSGER